ncbi:MULTISPECIES: MarC family protein [Candidatus Ichthyocystis]|uniref:MarC family protein n=1 Tax=Candidatus Ichthyocystis TaxID=2929841 RepID=UPI000B837420|nr:MULTISPECIES: MarC family protein [Ichthyocystis]
MSSSSISYFISSLAILLLVLDPLGNIAAVVAILHSVAPSRRRFFILREGFIATLILLLFMFFGNGILSLIKLSSSSLQISGGILLFIISLDLVFPGGTVKNASSTEGCITHEEPFIFPVAVPLLAGPSAIATVMLLSNQSSKLLNSSALIIAMIISTITLLSSEWIYKSLGKQTMNAIVRLMGLILSTISVQMVLAGIKEFVHSM